MYYLHVPLLVLHQIVWFKTQMGMSTILYITSRKRTVVASRMSGHHLDTQTLQNHPFGHPNIFMRNFNFKHIPEFIHLNILPMTLYKDIMPCFNK